MLALKIDFLAGRYYATPWGRSVNEGTPEWPPSPFRLLRALLAAWYRDGGQEPEVFDRLIEALSELPAFSVPPATSGHVRHYMPGYAEGEKNKIFNSFTAPQGPVFVIWSGLELDAATKGLLDILLGRLGYLGRSESWVDMRIEETPPEANLVAAGAGEEADVQMLCPASAGDWPARRAGIRQSEEERLLAKKTEEGKRASMTRKEKTALDAVAPEEFREALGVDTGILREGGWSFPPASQDVGYRWVTGEPRPVARRRTRQAPQAVTVARYLISSEVLPGYTELLSISERARKILMGIVGARNAGEIPLELSGRTPDGRPAATDHSHIYFIPEPGNDSRWVAYLNLYCPAGFPDPVKENFHRLDRVWGSGGHDIRLTLLTTGTPQSIGGTGEGRSPVMAEAREWVSLSPFIPSRHLKVKRSETHDPWTHAEAVAREVDRAVRHELSYHRLPEPVAVGLLPPYPGLGHGVFLQGHFTSWLEFRTMRLAGGGARGSRLPYGVRILFEEPVRGPISLGYACHFGIGLFRPAVQD